MFNDRYVTSNEYNLIHHAFSVINYLLQHIMLIGLIFLTHYIYIHVSVFMLLSHLKWRLSSMYIFCFQHVHLNFRIFTIDKVKYIWPVVLVDNNFIFITCKMRGHNKHFCWNIKKVVSQLSSKKKKKKKNQKTCIIFSSEIYFQKILLFQYWMCTHLSGYWDHVWTSWRET